MTFPTATWDQCDPEEADCDPAALDAIAKQLTESAEGNPYEVCVARSGRIVANWAQGVAQGKPLRQASAAKSYYSCLLGIAVAEGKLTGPDERVVDHYPQMMDVPEDGGPKPGRHVFPPNRDITFQHLICNVSGYMKPDEAPGLVFHYQTYGMNVLTHALASLYGLYDTQDPDRLPGCGKFLEEKVRDPIGGKWGYEYSNFELQPGAKLNVFGYYLQIYSNTQDMIRAGTLWLNYGRWNDVQIVPESYLREATVTNPFILKNEPEENWRYGHGFWVNDQGKQWHDLPKDSFAASGAGAKHIWVCPSLGLVVAQNPGLWDQFGKGDEAQRLAHQNDFLSRIVDAIH